MSNKPTSCQHGVQFPTRKLLDSWSGKTHAGTSMAESQRAALRRVKSSFRIGAHHIVDACTFSRLTFRAAITIRRLTSVGPVPGRRK
jgi:hypothetical protein